MCKLLTYEYVRDFSSKRFTSEQFTLANRFTSEQIDVDLN